MNSHFPRFSPLVPGSRFLIPRSFLSQTGALFGLDARIALAVFSVISVITGAALVLNMDNTNAKSLAGELTDTTRAVELMHNDLRADVFQALDKPSEKNAFQALYDNAVITEDNNLRSRWNGPYIKFTSPLHPRYGEMVLQKRGADHNQPCREDETCYLWLVYGEVKPAILKELNDELDGKEEQPKDTQGRVQWNNDRERTSALYFRLARALTSTTE